MRRLEVITKFDLDSSIQKGQPSLDINTMHLFKPTHLFVVVLLPALDGGPAGRDVLEVRLELEHKLPALSAARPVCVDGSDVARVDDRVEEDAADGAPARRGQGGGFQVGRATTAIRRSTVVAANKRSPVQ